jgi:Gram-negative porin
MQSNNDNVGLTGEGRLTIPTKAQRKRARTFLFVATLGVMGVFLSGRAHAEIKLLDVGGWTFSTDGRINNFISFASGDWLPAGEPSTYTGLDESQTSKNKIISTRIRSGFIMNVMAFELNKQLTEGTHLKTRVALWALTASERSAFDTPQVEARELYFKLEGNWGGLLVGRSLALFARGGILLDYDVEHGMGLGFPCSTKEVHGGACGHAGFGLLFPGFHSGFVYNTPNVGGLQLSVGLYDPVQYTSADYRRTPYPRPEAELAYASPNRMFTAFASGLWQRLSTTIMGSDMNLTDLDFNALGLNYGFGLNISHLKLAFSGFLGKGLGLLVPVEDNPAIILSGRPGLRSEDGYWGAAALVFGGFKVAGGAGVTRSKHDYADPPSSSQNVPFIAQQLGFSAGIYQQAFSMVTFALEYFGAQFTWFDHALPDGSIVRPRQMVNFVNAGATLVW